MKAGGVPSIALVSCVKRPSRPVSSRSSRCAASSGVSPASISPPTGSHVPRRLCLMSSTRPFGSRANVATENARLVICGEVPSTIRGPRQARALHRWWLHGADALEQRRDLEALALPELVGRSRRAQQFHSVREREPLGVLRAAHDL